MSCCHLPQLQLVRHMYKRSASTSFVLDVVDQLEVAYIITVKAVATSSSAFTVMLDAVVLLLRIPWAPIISAQPILTGTSTVHLVDNLNVGGLPPNSYHC